MEATRIFTGDTEAEIWRQIADDMAREQELFQYSAQIHQGGHTISFALEIDLGGGFESGYETTTFVAPVPVNPTLQFSFHQQDWLSELGKILGTEDIVLGYPELDAAFIIKTNEPATLTALFADESTRAIMLKQKNFDLTLGTELHATELGAALRFSKQEALADPADLQQVYHVLYVLLENIARLPVLNNTVD